MTDPAKYVVPADATIEDVDLDQEEVYLPDGLRLTEELAQKALAAVILEQGERNWSAYLPGLPGCVAAGGTREETLQLMREAIKFHLQGMREDEESIPAP